MRFPPIPGWLLLLLLVLAGAAPRLLGLDSVPPGLHPDEAVNAYEAWTLWETGHASDGRAFPLVFVMHGRYWAEGTYVWLACLAQALPLSFEAAARLPAALAGVFLVPAVFLLARRLLGPRAAWVAAALVALEPMAWHYSRVALRASLVPTLLALGAALLLAPAGASRARQLLRGLAAGCALALAVVTYTPARLFIPLLGLALVLSMHRRMKREPLPVALAAALVVVAVLASLPWSLSPAGQARFEAVSIFTQSESPLAAAGAFAKGYALQFSPRLLVWGSSSRGFWAEGVSPLLWIEAPLIVLGVGSLVARVRRGAKVPYESRGPAVAAFLLLWLLLYPLPSALTVPAPNPLRAIGGLPLWALLGAEGLRCAVVLARRLGGRRARRAVRPLVAAAVLLCAAWAARSYFVVFPENERRFWFANRSAAIQRTLDAAEAANADLTVDCLWVEASLVQVAGRRWQPRTEQLATDRARVTLSRGGAQRWTARLGPDALEAEDAAGTVVLRIALDVKD